MVANARVSRMLVLNGSYGLTHTIGRTYTSSDIFNAIDEAEDDGAR